MLLDRRHALYETGSCIFGFCRRSGQGPTVPGGCIRLPPPLNGRVRYDTDQAFGRTISRAVVTCDSGHAVPGETESVCTNGIWVPALIPRCERQSGRTSPGGEQELIHQLKGSSVLKWLDAVQLLVPL